MPYKNESMLMGMDASADTSTELCFNPPEGPFDASNVVKGTITAGDEDWIAIKLTEGNEYTIKVGGDTETAGALNDSVLKLMDGKGGLITMNDDTKPAEGMLGSQIKFTPEVGSGTQTYFISVSGYSGNPGAMNTGTYTVEVTETKMLPAGEGAPITGTDKADKLIGTENGETITGKDGPDVLTGLGGDDTLDGGKGADLLEGGAGADTLKGGSSKTDDGMEHQDTISYASSPEGVTIHLRAGVASGGDAEGDTLGEDIENVIGSMYDDNLAGDRGPNKLMGGGGNDDLSGDRGNDILNGGPGDDTLDGGDNDDTLTGGPGADELTGGGGSDTASWAGSMMGVTVRLHAQQAMGGDAEGDTWGSTVTEKYMVKEDGKDVEKEETVPDIMNLTGSGMADILAGDSRANTIKGGGGNDKLYGGPGGGDDKLHGDGGDDHLFGGLGDDDLYGGGGDDTLNGGAGKDDFYGGYGNDMIYADSADTTTINGWVKDQDPDTAGDQSDRTTALLGETAKDPNAVDTVSYEKVKMGGVNVTLGAGGVTNIENLIGTDQNDGDVKAGTGGLMGETGVSNVIEGRDGADRLVGNGEDAAPDTVSYRSSDRGVTVALDSDGTDGSASGGHAQGDTIASFHNAIGSARDDNLTGDDKDNKLTGLAGKDELTGGDGSDTLEGGAGADELDGGTTDAADDNVKGEEDDGVADTVSYESSDAAVTVNLATLTFSGGHAEGDEDEGAQANAYDPDDNGDLDPVDVSSFENVTGSMHNDQLTGDHRDNVLMGGKGNDTLRGMAGEDMLTGGPGADRLDGGEDAQEKDDMVPDPDDTDPSDGQDMIAASMDTASYAGAMMGVTVNLSTGRGTAGDAMGDTLVNIEKVEGSVHDDTFIAGEGVDRIDGGGNPDMGKGDTVSYELSYDGVTVTLTADNTGDTPQPAQADGNDESYATGDILYNIENVTGSSEDDVITGDTNPNTLMGGDGKDRLNGGDETDTDPGDKLMGGDGNDTLDGGGGMDTLMGGAGIDTIMGGTGNDTITGGAGGDTMTGGGGSDTFVFQQPADGNSIDDITDFETGDRIDLRAFNFKDDGSDLKGLIKARGNDIIIDLTSKDGGVIILGGDVNDVDSLEVTGGATTGVIDTLSVWMDMDADDTATSATDGNGVVDAGEAGIFIL